MEPRRAERRYAAPFQTHFGLFRVKVKVTLAEVHFADFDVVEKLFDLPLVHFEGLQPGRPQIGIARDGVKGSHPGAVAPPHEAMHLLQAFKSANKKQKNIN